ncbi:MAG: hypothetical protein KKD18_02605 [Nanoarchaeota archaeon]|nr:hypothetical protein [Nanoarchaeota archaeon]
MKTLPIILLLIALTGCVTPRPWTKAEKAMLIASCLATAADVFATDRAINNGCEEIGVPKTLLGKRPNTGKLIAFGGITQLGFCVIAHYWPDFRLWGLGFKTVANGAAAVSNSTQY